MKLFILSLVLLLSCVAVVGDLSAYQNEPNGFMEMRWGDSAGAKFPRDEFVGYSSDEKSTRYLKLNDNVPLNIEGVKLYSAVYSFFNGKFWKVELEARLLQAAKLLEAFVGTYGEATHVTQLSEFSKEYIWSGTTSDIVLTTSLNFYDRKTADIATAAIYSTDIKSVIDADLDHTQVDKKLPIDAIDGFRGRKWGSGFNKSATYLPLENEPYFEYLIQGDNLVFEGLNASEIRYRFYNNKALQKVELHFSGKQNYLKLKEACFRLFGQTSRYEQGEIRWIGKKTTISLSFTIDGQGTWLSKLNYMGYGSQ